MFTKEELVQVYKDTQKLSMTTYKKLTTCTSFANSTLQKEVSQSEMCQRVEVCLEDTITGAKNMKLYGYNPLVLVMANEWFPGGGVEHGISSQEEDIFRRSNIFLHVTENDYPLENNKMLYAKDVIVFKDTEYSILENVETYDFVFASGIPIPILKGGKLSNADKQIWLDKIRKLLYYAYLKGYDSMVLGAWGCGSYHNPPVDIAECFKKVIEECSYLNLHIRFSINSEEMCNIFKLFL